MTAEAPPQHPLNRSIPRSTAMSAVLERKPAAPATQNRSTLAKMTMTLMDHWALPTEDQAALLGIAAGNRAALTRSPNEATAGGLVPGGRPNGASPGDSAARFPRTKPIRGRGVALVSRTRPRRGGVCSVVPATRSQPHGSPPTNPRCCGAFPERFGDVIKSYLGHDRTVGHRPPDTVTMPVDERRRQLAARSRWHRA